jgi:hypothetical protein
MLSINRTARCLICLESTLKETKSCSVSVLFALIESKFSRSSTFALKPKRVIISYESCAELGDTIALGLNPLEPSVGPSPEKSID